MKIQMSTVEAENILNPIMASRFDVSKAEVSIVKPPMPAMSDLILLVRKFHPVTEKLASIKAVREAYAAKGFQMGLYDAKVFVEAINENRR